MIKPKTYIFDCETQEGVLRELTDDEYEQHLELKAKVEAQQAELSASFNPSE